MPSPTTAIALITAAAQRIGVIAVGETLSADDANLGLSILNDVLEAWSIMSLAVWAGDLETFTTVAGQARYSIGPGGDFDTTRPLLINQMFIQIEGVDFPIGEWTLGQYDAVGIKTIQQQIVERFVYLNTETEGAIILWPVPQVNASITIDAPRMLNQVPSLASTLTMPPGYVGALKYAVAVEMAPNFGSVINVEKLARAKLAQVKRANRQPQISNMDSTLLGGRPQVATRGW
jgi:hypothetical protein